MPCDWACATTNMGFSLTAPVRKMILTIVFPLYIKPTQTLVLVTNYCSTTNMGFSQDDLHNPDDTLYCQVLPIQLETLIVLQFKL